MKRITHLITAEKAKSLRSVLVNSLSLQPLTVETTKTYIITKFNNMNTFYKHLSGLDELEYYQDRVIQLQTNLSEAQQKRRQLTYILADIRIRSQDIQERLHKVKRREDPTHFLELMKEETEFLKKEREVSSELIEQERFERDIFTAFTNAIRDSQEKQRNRLEYTKYIGFGLTLLGALGSYLITTWRTKDLKTVIQNSIQEDIMLAFKQSHNEQLKLDEQQRIQGELKNINTALNSLILAQESYSLVLEGLKHDASTNAIPSKLEHKEVTSNNNSISTVPHNSQAVNATDSKLAQHENNTWNELLGSTRRVQHPEGTKTSRPPAIPHYSQPNNEIDLLIGTGVCIIALAFLSLCCCR